MKYPLAACALLLALAPAWGQESYSPPRTPDGKADLQGVWSNQALTNLSRAPGMKLTVTPEEAKELIRNNPWILLAQSEEGVSDFEDGLLDDGNNDRGYNTFWIDPGVAFATVKGEIRTSWLVEPADGRVPVSPAGQKARADAAAPKRATMYEGPETLPIAERCLIGFTGAGGPGMLNTIYNNNYQIVQTPDHVMILVEMIHDARIIPISGKHRPDAIRSWMGDSIGRYEGDTLVVETTNFRPGLAFRGAPEDITLIERFTRVSDTQILYAFEINEPDVFTAPIRAEIALNAVKGPVLEYACHEGNYSFGNQLQTQRLAEASN